MTTDAAKLLAWVAEVEGRHHSKNRVYRDGDECEYCSQPDVWPCDAAKLAKVVRETVGAMQAECAKFNFPDEDRPLLVSGLIAAVRASGLEGR